MWWGMHVMPYAIAHAMAYVMAWTFPCATLELKWCYKRWFLTTTFKAILLHKKYIRVIWRLQTIFNATFVAATGCTTLNRFQFLTTLLQHIAWLSWYTYRFLCNNIALKNVPCNITCIETCLLTLAALNQKIHIQNVIL